MTERLCPCCGQPVHRHVDRQARYYCSHCDSELCEVQVVLDEKRPPYFKHVDPYCKGRVVRK